jgi:putative glutathione S-transferase
MRATFASEKDRYHLFVACACPWAQSALITSAVKRLEDVISITIVQPVWQNTKSDDPDDKHNGWISFAFPDAGKPCPNNIGLGEPFPPSYPENEPKPFFDFFNIRDLYDHAGDFEGKYSVPIFWDKKLNTIVSNK